MSKLTAQQIAARNAHCVNLCHGIPTEDIVDFIQERAASFQNPIKNPEDRLALIDKGTLSEIISDLRVAQSAAAMSVLSDSYVSVMEDALRDVVRHFGYDPDGVTAWRDEVFVWQMRDDLSHRPGLASVILACIKALDREHHNTMQKPPQEG